MHHFIFVFASLWSKFGILGKTRQKQPPRDVLRENCSENMQQIYRRTDMQKCDFHQIKFCRFFSNFHLNVINISSYKKLNNAKEFFPLDSDSFFPLCIRNKLLTFYKVISVLGKCKEYTKKACSIITSLASPTKISVTNFEKCPNMEFFLVRIFLYLDWIWRFPE